MSNSSLSNSNRRIDFDTRRSSVPSTTGRVGNASSTAEPHNHHFKFSALGFRLSLTPLLRRRKSSTRRRSTSGGRTPPERSKGLLEETVEESTAELVESRFEQRGRAAPRFGSVCYGPGHRLQMPLIPPTIVVKCVDEEDVASCHDDESEGDEEDETAQTAREAAEAAERQILIEKTKDKVIYSQFMNSNVGKWRRNALLPSHTLDLDIKELLQAMEDAAISEAINNCF